MLPTVNKKDFEETFWNYISMFLLLLWTYFSNFISTFVVKFVLYVFFVFEKSDEFLIYRLGSTCSKWKIKTLEHRSKTLF